MHLIQLRRPLQRAAVSGCRKLTPVVQSSFASLSERFAQLRIDVALGNTAVQGRRYASVKSQGAYRLTNKKTIPKKLGAKKTGDQYVIPGNIIYKQRGTIWHPGENAIMGRDHTIHAAVAGYVKYYRDPQRHPKRQYIGVVFNRDDKLPYPVGAPRKRKVGLQAVPRKEIEAAEERVGASGIPLVVTRHEAIEISSTSVDGTVSETVISETTSEIPRTFTDGNAVIAALREEKLKSRIAQDAKRKVLREQQARELRARMGTRVFRLQNDYSYRETNWEIGRLVGDPGSVPGTEKTFSRKSSMRFRRKRRNSTYTEVKKRALEKVERRVQYRKNVWDKRLQRAAARTVNADKSQAKSAKSASEGGDKVKA